MPRQYASFSRPVEELRHLRRPGKKEFEIFFKKRLTAAGLDSSKYTLHGFRHGSIQTAMLVEDNMAMVALTSDHSSSAIEAYTRIPATSRMRVCAKMVRLLHST